jgi:hypothetical protein
VGGLRDLIACRKPSQLPNRIVPTFTNILKNRTFLGFLNFVKNLNSKRHDPVVGGVLEPKLLTRPDGRSADFPRKNNSVRPFLINLTKKGWRLYIILA